MLKGHNVFLRPIVRDDLYNLNKWKNDVEVYGNLGGGFVPISKDQHEKWMDSIIDLTGEDKRFIISTTKGASVQ